MTQIKEETETKTERRRKTETKTEGEEGRETPHNLVCKKFPWLSHAKNK